MSKFHKFFGKIAVETSLLSSATKLKVGAVVVKDRRILSIGYNGTPAGWDNQCEDLVHHHELGTATQYTKSEVIHAEANALMKLCQSTESSKDAVMYVTHYPCIECAKLIYQAGIAQVYYINDYSATKGTGKEFLTNASIQVTQLDET